jgi:homoprotocatechuate degradation regulator HpaR
VQDGTSPAGQGATEDAPRNAPTRVRLRDFSRSLPMSLLRAREAVMQHFRPGLRHFGITEQQWRVLRALTAVESIEIMALAEATYLLAPSLSRILKDLDERELIVRSTISSDLRRGLISISPKGRALIETTGSYSEDIYAEITRRFGPERMKALYDLLSELEAELSGPQIAPAVSEPMPEEAAARPRRGRPRSA